MQNTRPELGTVKDVCRELGNCNPATVYRRVADGTIQKPIKIGGRSFWDLNAIRARIAAMLEEVEAA